MWLLLLHKDEVFAMTSRTEHPGVEHQRAGNKRLNHRKQTNTIKAFLLELVCLSVHMKGLDPVIASVYRAQLTGIETFAYIVLRVLILQ